MSLDQYSSSIVNEGRGDAGGAGDSSGVRDDVQRSNIGIIVNADDWGSDIVTTARTLDCVLRGVVSSVSAMVFMEDSERAADLAQQHGIDAGLHLNLTTPLHAPKASSRLTEHQRKVSHFLTANRFAFMLYHPGLANSFEYVVKAQLEEFTRLYGAPAERVDGHHHMHLSTNVVLQKLLPENIIVRRNFTFGPGEKGYFNRLYRRRLDQRLARRHRMTDYFFDLRPLETSRLARIMALSARCSVEVETHPIRQDEYRFLVDGEFMRCVGEGAVARGYLLPERQGRHSHQMGHSGTVVGAPVPPPVARP
jgi:hypothetical protein